jgi:hypothetical protein
VRRSGGGWADCWPSRPTRERREREELGRVERRGEGKEGRAERSFGLPFPFSFLFFFPTLKLFKQFYLNSNNFEFKPYKLNTRKTMLQHECTNKLIL